MELPMPKEKPSFYAGDVIHQYRSELIQKEMKAHGFDAILSLRPETVRFCTGFFAKGFKRFWESVYFTLIPYGKEPVVGYRSGSDWWRIQLRSEIKDIRRLPGGVTRWPEVLSPVFNDYGLQSARVGTDILPYEIYAALKKEYPKAEFEDASEFWVDVTAVKHPEEINWIRQAVRIVDIGTQAAIDFIAPGKREIDVSVEASCAMLRAGAEMMPSLHNVASGYNAGIWERIATEKVIQEGELVAMDITASVRGYVGDIGRTVMVGKAKDEQKRIYKVVYEGLMSAIDIVKPGITVREVNDACRSVISKAGYDKYQSKFWTGHQIGYGIHGEPAISHDVEYVLKPNMVFALEPRINMFDRPDVGGVHIEDNVLVTETGHEKLSHCSYDEQLLG